MAKLVTGVFLIYFTIIQFYSVSGFDNATDPTDLIEEDRLLFGGMIRIKCRAQLTAASTVLPNVGVTPTRLSNGRLYFFSLPANVVPFEAARTFCREHGMHLVTINSVGENLLVYTKATELGMAVATVGTWIGYRDVSGTYKWVYPPKVGSTPTFFAATSTPPMPGNCAGYGLAGTPAAVVSWTTFLCSTNHAFICEMEPPCSLVL